MGVDGLLTDETVNYIVMILIYSGLGSWLVSRLTTSREDARRAERREIDETLGLLDRVTRARDALRGAGAAEERVAAYDAMRQRLSDEVAVSVAALNMTAAEEIETPSSRFVVIPTPLTFWGVFLILVFSSTLYFGVMAWLTLGFYFLTRDDFDILTSVASQNQALFMFGGGLTLIGIALGARLWAYGHYDRVIGRRREAANS